MIVFLVGFVSFIVGLELGFYLENKELLNKAQDAECCICGENDGDKGNYLIIYLCEDCKEEEDED